MPDFKYILFDLDGTLINSEAGVLRCIKLALKEINQEDAPYSTLRKMIGPPFRQSMKEFFGVEGQEIENLIKKYRTQYDIDGWCDCKVYDGVMDMLKKLKESGKTIALATSKPERFTQKIMDHFGFLPYFDFIGASLGDGTRDRKSKVISHVFLSLGIKDIDKAVMVGDTKYDIYGAKEAGIKSVGILWGFGDRAELEEAGADYIANNPLDVLKLLV